MVSLSRSVLDEVAHVRDQRVQVAIQGVGIVFQEVERVADQQGQQLQTLAQDMAVQEARISR